MWGLLGRRRTRRRLLLAWPWPNSGQSNYARFRLPAFDRLYDASVCCPRPERLSLMRQANKLMLAYVPYIAHNHPIQTELSSRLRGPLRQPFSSDVIA